MIPHRPRGASRRRRSVIWSVEVSRQIDIDGKPMFVIETECPCGAWISIPEGSGTTGFEEWLYEHSLCAD